MDTKETLKLDSQEALKPIFDHIRKTAIDKKAISLGGNKYQENEVFATTTIHHAGDRRTGGKADFVLYGNGQLELKQANGQDILTGNIQVWINDVKTREVKESGIFSRMVTDRDIFPNTPIFGMDLTVDETGLVSLCMTIEGKPWQDSTPVTFQPAATHELLVAIVQDGFMGSHGPCSITIGFTLSTHDRFDRS